MNSDDNLKTVYEFNNLNIFNNFRNNYSIYYFEFIIFFHNYVVIYIKIMLNLRI